ncbi:EAL domain-containing protein [Pontixanthobacter aestiaquae]|nr:EAL domain-containing protein [Pontixanthobacter aestiaquae]MDN3645894.1 EAL domain-containing protein [Pontixanthobacter aestiaquae]
MIAHAIAALVVGWVYWNLVSPVLLGVWLFCLVGAISFIGHCDRKLAGAENTRLTQEEFYRRTTAVTVVSLVWCVPTSIFALYGTLADLLTLWTAISALIVGLVLIVASAPLGTLIFTSLTGISAAATCLFLGEYPAAAMIVFFILVVTTGTIESARTYMTARIAEAGMAEKSEVVSLLLREFEENQADWLWQVDTKKRIRSVSPRFAFALGKPLEEIEGNSFLQLLAGDSWESGQFSPSLHELAEKLKNRENFSNLMIQVTINGRSCWWELSGTPIIDERDVYVGFRGVGSDVTEQRESSEKIAYLARYDTLTGLPNRLMLNEALRDAMLYAKQWRTRCAFLMLDLDRFKAVNDSLGHQVGDKMLAKVSERLKELMGENAICGRLGGDEFGIVIRDASAKGSVDALARRIIESLSQPYDIDGNTLYVGASVGSAVGPRDGKTVEELLRNSDLALYRAKDEGGSEHCQYEPTLHVHAEERRKLEASLRHALERDEMSLNFQPVVDANDETVVSFEALVRWNSEEHGFVGPDKFIPLAEDTRLIIPIGTWVMEQACIEACNWPSHVRVAVNVSGEQLIEPDFASTVIGALSKSGLEANRLEIEVTESIFLRDANVARAALEQVIALGCTVALDDFGTGYSSLGYLRKLSFSTIKVDRSFVQGAVQGSAESLAIINAVVAMAESLEMSTTAEGVENAEEAEFIRKLGCKKIQGYYFGRPMPAHDARQIFVREGLRRA